MTTHRVPVSICPACGCEFNFAGAPGFDERPKPGDLLLCIECAVPLRFDEHMQPVPLPQAEIEALPVEVQNQLVRVSAAIVAVGEEMERKRHLQLVREDEDG